VAYRSTPIAHGLFQSPDGNGVTSSALDTTGADLIVVGVVSFSTNAAPTISDSKGNAWLSAGAGYVNGSRRLQWYYCQAPVVGTGHTFSAAGAGTFDAIAVFATSGSASSPLDQQAGNAGSATPGSITPTAAGELVLTLVTDAQAGSVSTAVSGGFTIPDTPLPFVSGQTFAVGLAYLVQTTAAAANPTWSGGVAPGSAIISFKAAGGGGTVGSLFWWDQYGVPK